MKKQNRKGESDEQVGTKRKVTRQSVAPATMTMTEGEGFCGESSGNLGKTSTFEIDRCALELHSTCKIQYFWQN